MKGRASTRARIVGGPTPRGTGALRRARFGALRANKRRVVAQIEELAAHVAEACTFHRRASDHVEALFGSAANRLFCQMAVFSSGVPLSVGAYGDRRCHQAIIRCDVIEFLSVASPEHRRAAAGDRVDRPALNAAPNAMAPRGPISTALRRLMAGNGASRCRASGPCS
jgi:hypothetical protein